MTKGQGQTAIYLTNPLAESLPNSAYWLEIRDDNFYDIVKVSIKFWSKVKFLTPYDRYFTFLKITALSAHSNYISKQNLQ